jgi:hypothetical protein
MTTTVPRAVGASLAAAAIVWAAAGTAASADEVSFLPEPVPPATARRTIVDPAVVPAGGARCPHCPGGGCRHGVGQHRARGHHANCRPGMCVPYCPVRPAEFGFYGTRWRRWPGQQVVPVSADAATPAMPPRSEVPGADEESPRRPDEDRAGDGPADEPRTTPEPANAIPALPPERPVASGAPVPPEPPEESVPGGP